MLSITFQDSMNLWKKVLITTGLSHLNQSLSERDLLDVNSKSLKYFLFHFQSACIQVIQTAHERQDTSCYISDRDIDRKRFRFYLWVLFIVILLGAYPPPNQVVSDGMCQGEIIISWCGNIAILHQSKVEMPVEVGLYFRDIAEPCNAPDTDLSSLLVVGQWLCHYLRGTSRRKPRTDVDIGLGDSQSPVAGRRRTLQKPRIFVTHPLLFVCSDGQASQCSWFLLEETRTGRFFTG